ncbi:MAG: hypothetical protein LBL87_06340 [Ruminococcus sp.]|jgi:hypothetical protein|nr:hypothetical protein [Ruminococcus sp.]
MDYNILYEEKPLLDFYIIKTAAGRYIYKAKTDVMMKASAHRFRTKQSAKRYAAKYGFADFVIIGVKLCGGKPRYVFFD